MTGLCHVTKSVLKCRKGRRKNKSDTLWGSLDQPLLVLKIKNRATSQSVLEVVKGKTATTAIKQQQKTDLYSIEPPERKAALPTSCF